MLFVLTFLPHQPDSGPTLSGCLKKLPYSCHESFMIWGIQLYQEKESAESWGYECPM